MTAQVTVNGNAIAFNDPATLREVVVRTLTRSDGTFSDRGVAVAVNQTVVPRTRWESTPVRQGDTIEIITAVQGG